MKKLLSLVLALTLCLGMAVPVCAANRTIHLASSAWLPEDHPEFKYQGGYKAAEVSANLGDITLYGDLERTGTVSVPLEYEDGTFDYPVYRSNGPVTVTINSGLDGDPNTSINFGDGWTDAWFPICIGIDTMSYDKDAKFYDTLKEDALYFDGKVQPPVSEDGKLPDAISIREFKEKGMEDEYGDSYYKGASAVLSEPGIYRVYFYVPALGYSTASAMIWVEKASTGEAQPVSFTDVPAKAWYAEPVAWAVEKGITNGTSKTTFSPNNTCNNSEILTFLWRACGKPTAEAASFSDVASGVWYADAANWAKSKGMVSGDTLSPTQPCTRASAVMFIWQAMGKPAASEAAAFTDVPANADYAAAVAWAVEKGVTNGTGADTFSPDGICTRAQIVAFLQRAYA